MSSLEELVAQITAKGNEIRELKAAKATKEEIDVAVASLLAIKESYKILNNGIAYEPPKEVKPEKVKGPAQTAPVVEREGPSKKELNKLARKEKRKENTNKGDADGEGEPSINELGEATGEFNHIYHHYGHIYIYFIFYILFSNELI